MTRLLVTGRSGFVGGTVTSVVASDPALAGWQLADIDPGLDLRDRAAVRKLVHDTAPDAVLHLAAQSWVPDAFRDPESTLQINLIGTLHLLQALHEVGFSGRMVFVSSGDVYGLVPEHALPVPETRLPAPRNPYAVSKLAAEALCWQWAAVENMAMMIARPFNHVGPGQSDRFVVAHLARQVAEVRAGMRPPVIEAGDVDVTRDFTDVRDVVRAYFALLEHGTSGEIYNVCSGVESKVRDLLERLSAMAGVPVDVRQDPERMRKSEQRRMAGDPGKIARATGWTASMDLDVTLAAMLADWERRIGQ